MPFWGRNGFQDSYYQVGEYLRFFHEGVMCLIVFILSLVLYGLRWVLLTKGRYRYLREAQGVETAWTIIPRVCLIGVAVPSIHLLYVMDEIGSPSFCFKAVGHQWYWRYEFIGENVDVLGFDSFIDRSDNSGRYRLLDVDQRMVVPANIGVRCMVSRADVIHSFAVPRCMLKVDAIPGRVNEITINVGISGVLYGQCSEICGANHSFIPIVIEFIPSRVYNRWHRVISSVDDVKLL